VSSYNAGGGLFGSPKDYLTFLQCLLNDGKYPGGQLLRAETVDLMFENQLGENMTVDYEVSDTLSSGDLGFIDESDKHGLAWAIEDNDNETIRPKRTGYWGGVANSYFTIDKENGVAVVYFSQIVPFNDKEAFGLFRLFEKEVYSQIRGK
jgi:methyl acetate hydrolase